VERIGKNFAEREIVQPLRHSLPDRGGVPEPTLSCGANTFSRLGYHTRTIYFTLGCNTRLTVTRLSEQGCTGASMPGTTLRSRRRMRRIGKVYLDPDLAVGFSMRRYQQFGTIKSISEWLYIVLRGGDAAVSPTRNGSISSPSRPGMRSRRPDPETQAEAVRRGDACGFARLLVWRSLRSPMGASGWPCR